MDHYPPIRELIARVRARWRALCALQATLRAAAAAAAIFACLWPLRRVPQDAAVARYIEEREPALDDRLVSAVDVARRRTAPGLADAMLADAARRSAGVDVDAIVPARSLKRAAIQAAAAAIALGLVLFAARAPAREAADAASLTL